MKVFAVDRCLSRALRPEMCEPLKSKRVCTFGVFPDARCRARRAGEAGRVDSMWGHSKEASGREERFPLPARCRLHQTEEPGPRTRGV